MIDVQNIFLKTRFKNIILRILKKLPRSTKRVNLNINVAIWGYIEKHGVKLGNRFIVSYHTPLMIRCWNHVNIEYCNKSNSIKYLFKYVNKGPDRETMQMSIDGKNCDKFKLIDEIKHDC